MATLAERAAAAQARLAPKAEQREAANAAAAPVKLNKSLQAAADYDGPVEKVELDGLAVLKILQHASGAISGPAGSIAAAPRGPALNAAGFVYGMQLGPQLSISNAFALPPNHLLPNNITSFSNVSISSSANADERTKAAKVAAEREKEVDAAYRNAKNFAGTFAPRAKELNLDSDIVGGYFVARDGMDLLREGVLVDILIRYQFGIGSGAGGASASGASGMASSADKRPAGANAKFKDASRLKKRGIAIVYDVSSSTSSSLSLKAYSLSPAFLQLYESTASNASHSFDYSSLASVGLTPSTLLVSYPVQITSSSLLTAFLAANPETQQLASSEHQKAYTALSADESLESNLKSLIGALDSSNASIQSLGYQGRAARYGGGSQSSNVDNLHRLDSLRTMAVAEGAAKNLGQEAGLGTVRAWAARSSVVQ